MGIVEADLCSSHTTRRLHAFSFTRSSEKVTSTGSMLHGETLVLARLCPAPRRAVLAACSNMIGRCSAHNWQDCFYKVGVIIFSHMITVLHLYYKHAKIVRAFSSSPLRHRAALGHHYQGVSPTCENSFSVVVKGCAKTHLPGATPGFLTSGRSS